MSRPPQDGLPLPQAITLPNGKKPAAVVMGAEHYNALANIRALGRRGVPVFAASDDPKAIGFRSRYVSDSIVHPDLSHEPQAAVEKLLRGLADLAERGYLPLIVPTGDRHLEFLGQFRTELGEAARLHLPDDELLRRIMAKHHQYQVADQVGVAYPRTWTHETAVTLVAQIEAGAAECPFLFKASSILPDPAMNRQFRRRPLATMDDLCALIRDANQANVEFVLQEIIPGADDQLYTAGITRTKHGDCTGIFTGRKLRQMPPQFGVCRVGEAVINEDIAGLGKKLLDAFNFFGIAQIEFKYDARDQQYKLMEINPRSWSWIGLAPAVGIDLTYLYFLDAFKVTVPPQYQQLTANTLWLSFWDDLAKSIQYRDGRPLSHFSMARKKVDAYWAKDDLRPGFAAIPSGLKEALRNALRIYK